MNWFLASMICILAWGFADLFYKTGSEETDRWSHLKIAVWVGLVMGASSALLLLAGQGPEDLGAELVRYLPASLSYIVSMVIGYAGLRYLELSVASPVQNASGALAAACLLAQLALTGRIGSVFDELSVLDLAGTLLIAAGMIALAVVEQREAAADAEDPRYVKGALALLFPLLYCVFDTVGTAADGILLQEETGMGLGETQVLVLYGFTFFAAGLVCWIVLRVKTGSFYRPFARSERPKALAAVCEELGQIFYVFAMAARPVTAAPLVSSYCIFSALLSARVLKERPGRKRGICIALVIGGILLMGISEGLANR